MCQHIKNYILISSNQEQASFHKGKILIKPVEVKTEQNKTCQYLSNVKSLPQKLRRCL